MPADERSAHLLPLAFPARHECAVTICSISYDPPLKS